MNEKRCYKCLQTKPVSEFYRNASNNDGLAGECKLCRKAIQARVMSDPEYRKAVTKRLEKIHKANPEKVAASIKVRTALRYGKMQKHPCIICGDPKSEGHHVDYSRPLDVVWLCRSHHKQTHVLHADLQKAEANLVR